MMVDDFGFDLDTLRSFMQNGLDAAWIGEDERAHWRKQWTSEFDALRAGLDG